MGRKKKSNPVVDNRKLKITLEHFLLGYPERQHKPRWKMFATKGYNCVQCGIAGTHVIFWEDKGGGLHVDLFGHKEDGKEIMLTIDHIVPRSKGGANHIDNYQPMCEPCNCKKADKVVL